QHANITRFVFYAGNFIKMIVFGAQAPIVRTPSGSVMGRHIKSYGGRTVSAFEGIPFAKPPIGDLRFKEPKKAEPWTSILVANKTYTCMQYTAIVPSKSVLGTEDCLYLYIYVPREIIFGNESLNVIINIHGGAFVSGDPQSSTGPGYIMDKDLIHVSMNYRLGILGFLSTEDEVVPGNNGLKDQVFAMKWVKDNIKYFGGNPNSITLIGASSGASCVHYHYLSPLSKGLFHRGMSQSGTVLNHWALTKNPSNNAKELGKLFKCSLETSNALVNCLKKVPAENVTLALGNFFIFANAFPSSPFGPVIENNGSNAFLNDHPYKLLKEGKINDYPWISSNVRDEGIVPIGFFILFGHLPELEVYWNDLLPYVLGYYQSTSETDRLGISYRLKDRYMNTNYITSGNIYSLIKLFTDRLFLVDGIKAASLQAKVAKSPNYYYFFDYHLDLPVSFKANLTVVAHGDDSRILYHETGNPSILSESDEKMKNLFIDLVYDFASSGTLTVKGVEWTPVSKLEDALDFMHISGPDKIRMVKDPPLVKTSLGFVLGRYIKSYEGRTATAFEGIPYAKPPVGNLRFKV
ncbi:hypothetical protein ILUMI_08884, partial [Ignelater luminosus]